jgi:hypothetical protein
MPARPPVCATAAQPDIFRSRRLVMQPMVSSCDRCAPKSAHPRSRACARRGSCQLCALTLRCPTGVSLLELQRSNSGQRSFIIRLLSLDRISHSGHETARSRWRDDRRCYSSRSWRASAAMQTARRGGGLDV